MKLYGGNMGPIEFSIGTIKNQEKHVDLKKENLLTTTTTYFAVLKKSQM
jgi:hypothetical protein